MQFQIRCTVYPGQFSHEYAVCSVQAHGKKFSLFAPLKDVEPDEPPTRERSVDGWLTVSIWELVEDRAIVRLPRESFESGWYVTVKLSQFKVRPEPIEA